MTVAKENLSKLFLRLGRTHYGSLPWHTTNDPYSIFVAEYFLRRTTRTVVSRIYQAVLSSYPKLDQLSEADPECLVILAKDGGLYGRTRQLVATAKDILECGGFRADHEFLLSQNAVGPYIADAVLLYAYGEKTFPLDSSVQRVLYRAVLAKDAKKDSKPYRDTALIEVVGMLVSEYGAEDTRLLHQGVLAVAWAACRQHPICRSCPVMEFCRYPAKTNG